MRRLVLGLSLLGLSACGLESTSSLQEQSTQLPGSIVDQTLAAQVIGSYAVRTRLATIQTVPVLGKSPSLSERFGLITIEAAGEGLQVRESNCRIDITSKGPAQPSIPEAFTQAIPTVTAPFRVWTEGEQVLFAKDAVPTVIGAELLDPTRDALPTRANDPRVKDQDKDGKPGVTIKVSGSLINGEIYLVQRLNYSWQGRVSQPRQLSALLLDKGDQSIVDASQAILKSNVPVVNDPDASKSNVSFVELTEAYDCARLNKEAKQLFGSR